MKTITPPVFTFQVLSTKTRRIGILISTLCVLITTLSYANPEVTIRLEPVFYDDRSESVYISIDLKYEGQEDFFLADQNYRIFYNSDVLTLNQKRSKSELPGKMYSKIFFNEILENLKAGYVNDLPFDNEMGFINFNIDLKDIVKGGLKLDNTGEWKRVAVLNFKVHDKIALSNIVWSAEGKTDNYATAFVEIMEWVGPYKTEHAPVKEHIDAQFSIGKSIRDLFLTVAPNPVIDVLNLSFDLPIKKNVTIAVTDAIGRRLFEQEMEAGTMLTELDVSLLSPGTYNLEIFEEGMTIGAHQTSFVKIRS